MTHCQEHPNKSTILSTTKLLGHGIAPSLSYKYDCFLKTRAPFIFLKKKKCRATEKRWLGVPGVPRGNHLNGAQHKEMKPLPVSPFPDWIHNACGNCTFEKKIFNAGGLCLGTAQLQCDTIPMQVQREIDH